MGYARDKALFNRLYNFSTLIKSTIVAVMGGGVNSKLNSELKICMARRFATLDSKLEDINDDCVGLEFIEEQKMPLVRDTRLAGEFLEDKCKDFEDSLKLPLPSEEILVQYAFFLEKNQEQIKMEMNLRSVSYCTKEEKATFLECEILHPILAVNKRAFKEIITQEIKKFLSKCDISKKLIFKDTKLRLGQIIKDKPIDEVLNHLIQLLKTTEGQCKYFELTFASNSDQMDHIERSYQIFKHNMESYLKLMVYFLEEETMKYKLFNQTENHNNYKVLRHNIFVWIVKNLEKNNFTIYKYWNNELERINNAMNLLISKSRIISLLHDNKCNFRNVISKLSEIHFKIQDDIFELNTFPDNYLAYLSIRKKYSNLMKKLLSNKLPEFYDCWGTLKGSIKSLIEQDLKTTFIQKIPLFNKKIILQRYSGKKADYYDHLMIDIGIIVLYKMNCTFLSKYNFLEEQRMSIFEKFYKEVYPQLGKQGQEKFPRLLQQAMKKDLELIIDYLSSDYHEAINNFNDDKGISIGLMVYMLFSLTCLFTNIKLKRNSETIDSIKIGSYPSSYRVILNSIAKGLRNYDFGFHNWKVITYLEDKVVEFLYKHQGSSTYKIQTAVKGVFYNEDYYSIMKEGSPFEIKLMLRENYQRMSKFLTFSMKQDFNLDEIKDKFDIVSILKDKLFREQFFGLNCINRTSGEQKSKHIIIICSGFTNLIDDDAKQWRGLVERASSAEIFTFKWPSFYSEDSESTESMIKALIGKNAQRKDVFMIGAALFSNAHIKGLQLTGMEFKEPHHQSLYHMAVFSGKALAYFLGELNLFEKEIVSLVGFSTGSIVAWSCLRDLFLMRKSEQIYNFSTIGGLLSRKHISTEILKLFPGSYFNIYSMNDKVLSYASNMEKEYEESVGLSDVNFSNGLEDEKNIKVYNLNLSDQVRNHHDYFSHLNLIADFIKFTDMNSYIERKVLKRKKLSIEEDK